MERIKTEQIEQTENKKQLALKRVIGILSLLIFIGLMVWASFALGGPLIRQFFGSEDVREADLTMFRDMVAENPVKELPFGVVDFL